MNTELKQLIEDAAKLIGLEQVHHCYDFDDDGEPSVEWLCLIGKRNGATIKLNPLDPERGDLMKVMEAAELVIDFEHNRVVLPREEDYCAYHFTKGDYQSLVYAALRAASAVFKARGE